LFSLPLGKLFPTLAVYDDEIVVDWDVDCRQLQPEKKGKSAMKKMAISLLILGLLVMAAPVQGQFLGHLRPAETLGMGSLRLGTSVGVFQDAFTLTGRIQYGLAAVIDFTADLGLLDYENTDDPELLLGAALHFQALQYNLGNPVDMTVGFFTEYYELDRGPYKDYSDISLGVSLAMSRPLRFPSGLEVIPYGEANIRIDRVETFRGTDSDFNLGLNLGAALPLSGTAQFVAEAQLDDQFGVLVGINFLMW
jgi:hypothetical protein